MSSQEIFTFFPLKESQDPYHPALTTALIQHLSSEIAIQQFEGERARSGDLLIHRSENAHHGIVMESHGPYMGKWQADLETIIYRTTQSSHTLSSLSVVIPYMELRDDKDANGTGSLDKLFSSKLANADQLKKIRNIALWDPHSTMALQHLHEAFTQHDNPVAIMPVTAVRLFVEQFITDPTHADTKHFAFVSLDLGGLHRCILAAQEARITFGIDIPVILLEKTRPAIEKVEFKGVYIADAITGFATPATEKDIANLVCLTIDDLGGTGRTTIEGTTLLKKTFSAKETHAAITHAAFIQPEAKKKLYTAIENGNLNSITLTDSLPQTMDGTTRLVPLAKHTAAVMRSIANVSRAEDDTLLKQISYMPGPQKSQLTELLQSGKLPLRHEIWPVQILPPDGTLYTYSPEAN